MAHTWEIEYRGTLADGASGGDKRTIAAWGLSELGELTEANLARGGMALTIASGTAFLDDLPWSYRDKIVLWRDGVRHWHGWLTNEPRSASPESESATLIFGDPWWWFEATTMTAPTVKDAITGTVSFTVAGLGTVSYPAITSIAWAEPSGDVVFAWRDQSSATIQGQIRRAFYAVTRGGAPLALGSIGVDAPAPPQDVAGTTALSYLQSACTYEPNTVGWWDYSGVTPALHCQPRIALSATSYSLAGYPASVQCEPLRTEQALAVRIRWHYPDSNGDDTTYTERAGSDALPIGPNVLVIDANVSDADALTEAVSYGIAARMYASIGPLAYGGALTLTDDLTAGFALRPGRALNLTGGRAEWATMAGIVQQTTLSVTADADTLSISWGAPRHLGVQDWLALRDIGNGGASSAKWEPDGPTTDDPKPGTYDDLNNTPASTPAGTIAIQSRGGGWQIGGWDEYIVSTPPRKYLTRALGGSIHRDGYSGTETCNLTPSYSQDLVMSGVSAWAWQSGALIRTTYGQMQVDSETPINVDNAYKFNPDEYVEARARTTLSYAHGGVCHGNGNSTSQRCTGTTTETLGSEDTESNAIARLLATDPAWADNGTAIQTRRTSVFTGLYRELRWGTYNAAGVYTPLTGLGAQNRWRIRGTIEIRPVNETGAATGDWAATGETASPAFVSLFDGTGGVEWITIAPTPGYETRITGITPEPY